MAGTPVIGPFPSQEFTRTIFAVRNTNGSNCDAAVDQLTDATPWFLADGMSSQVHYSTKVWRASNINANLSAVLVGIGTMTSNTVAPQFGTAAEEHHQERFWPGYSTWAIRGPFPSKKALSACRRAYPAMIRGAQEGSFRSWLVTRRSIITPHNRHDAIAGFLQRVRLDQFSAARASVRTR